MMEKGCAFKFRYGDECDEQKSLSETSGAARLQTIIKASQVYGDSLHLQLEKQLADNENLKILYHRNCVSRYTSKTNLAKYNSNDDAPPPKKLRRSSTVFDFKRHCLYCGRECEVKKDTKNPGRWTPAYMCRSTHSEHDGKPYKEYLLEKCGTRNDHWASEVRIRIEGAVSDLHAVEARYHKDCMSFFVSNRLLSDDQQGTTSKQVEIDQALQHVIDILEADRSCIWNSIELFEEYQDNDGCALTRAHLIEELRHHFGAELTVLSSPGYANLIVFHRNAAVKLKMVKDDKENDDIEINIGKVAKQIVKECKSIIYDKSTYLVHIDNNIATEFASDTLLRLLTAISPKLDKTLPALLIGNILTDVINCHPTPLQVALGVLLRDSKTIVRHMYDYRVTCSYDEVLRFRRSAAVAAAAEPNKQGISNVTDGLVQVVADNFDTDISSPNGKLSTHSLAMIIIQPNHEEDTQEDETIRRLNKDEMSHPISDGQDTTHENFRCQKKPTMPELPTASLPSDIVSLQNVSWKRAEEIDFTFFGDVLTVDKCPEFNGYNTKLCREQGHSLASKTKVVYLPLIDKPPADSGTIMTAMVKAEKISEGAGQKYTIFTLDQQLYRIALHILWENKTRFQNFILRLGGMHLLMSYCGCIGTLMADTGIVEILSAAFGGVLKMLTGKKFPQNVRALRMLVEELLRPLFGKHNFQAMAHLQHELDDVSLKSKTAKLWVDCLIKPIFTILKYIRAEREADWALHLETVKEMTPLFFAAGHIHYARYGLYYLRSMEHLPTEAHKPFMAGEHAMHHTSGLFNGIWTDMAIETTFMRYGHGRSGIVGITLKPETLKTWAYSLHACSVIINDLNEMRDMESPPTHTYHKEEMQARLKADAKDRKVLRDYIEHIIDPLDPDMHPDGLVNVVTGKVVVHPSVNVNKAVALGKAQMESFENSWPGGFHDTISKVVNTMTFTRKHLKVGDIKVFDTETIYARAMCLQSSSRSLDTDSILAHELSPYPTSMFDADGQMREAKSKANLKNALKVEVSSRNAEKDIDAIFLDGCAILWVVQWPTAGTVQDYLDRFRSYLHTHVKKSDVYLVFDRYKEDSTKKSTRQGREKGASRLYTLRTTTRLPPQKLILTVTTNKSQVIDLICEDIISHKEDFTHHKLVVTGSDPVPVEINSGIIIKRQDMKTTQEEADTIIVQQVADVQAERALVVADDTDIFVLLLHFCCQGDISPSCSVMMVSPIQGRAVIDINATVEQHHSIIPDLLSAHGLTGCDTVATYFGIGKAVALKVLRSGRYPLSNMGETSHLLSEITAQATPFILACYGQTRYQTMTQARQKMWASKVGRSVAGAPKLASLPPTNEAFKQNVARAHLQIAVWRNALAPDPPTLDPTTHGWSWEDGSKSLVPRTVPDDIPLAPEDLLKLIKCSCASELPCNTQRCGCNSANLACSVFCACQGSQGCFNEKTKQSNQTEDNDEED